MSRLNINTPNAAQQVVEGLYRDVERRIVASPPGLCPVDMSASFLKMCHAQTCGKCAPCRVGLGQLGQLLEDVLDGAATLDTIDLIERTARAIKNSADCAIGYEAADMVSETTMWNTSSTAAACSSSISRCPAWPYAPPGWISRVMWP